MKVFEKHLVKHESQIEICPNSLLRIRSDTNAEITRMIMLRERRTSGTPRTSDGDCDCGILSDVLDGLNKVVADDAVVAAGEQADFFTC